MTGILKYILPRLGISLLVIFAIAYVFIINPRQADQRTIKRHTQAVQASDEFLQKAREQLKDLAPPKSVATAKPGAREYANKLSEAQGSFDTTVPTPPQPIQNYKQDVHLARFNSIVTNPDYQNQLRQSHEILITNKSFLLHESKVMLALANLLEYDPGSDLSSSDAETLTQHLGAMQGGLSTTIQRLNQAPRYDKDTSLSEIVKEINDLEQQRGQLATNVSRPDFTMQKQAFIEDTHDVQQKILANRNSFWIAESPKLFKLTDQAEKTLVFYLKNLQHV